MNIRYGEATSRKRVKRYGCLFTCFATRVVHLEVCNSLSTDSFMCVFNDFCEAGVFILYRYGVIRQRVRLVRAMKSRKLWETWTRTRKRGC